MTIKKAAEDARALTRMFKSVISVVDELDRIGSIEQTESELKASTDRLRKEHAEMVEKNKTLNSKGEEDAAKLKADARAEADRIVNEAKASAEKMATDAKANAERVVDKAEAKRQQLEQANASAEANLQALRDKQTRLQSECIDLESRIEKAKAQVEKMLGA